MWCYYKSMLIQLSRRNCNYQCPWSSQHAGAGKVPAGTDTPRSCSTCSSVERGPEKPARSKLSAFLQHLGDDGLAPVAQRDLVSISRSHRGNVRRKARKHGEGCQETYHLVVATVSGGSSSTSSSLHGRDYKLFNKSCLLP